VIKLLTGVLRAFVAHLEWKRRNYIYELEDKLDDLAADGSPAAKLRMERLGLRIQFERERITRPANSDAEKG